TCNVMRSHKVGNTSACAEKSSMRDYTSFFKGKYLRVRGEEGVKVRCGSSIAEIPPRARRRARYSSALLSILGNTSACAEKSQHLDGSPLTGGKYLRVRGEEEVRADFCSICLEIPPRARRRESPTCDYIIKK